MTSIFLLIRVVLHTINIKEIIKLIQASSPIKLFYVINALLIFVRWNK